VAAAAATVVLDLLIPTLVILLVAGVSLAVRRQGPSTLGLVRLRSAGQLATLVLALTVIWTAVQLAFILPLVEHLTGRRQDLSEFENLRGDAATLAVLLVLSWTLAALGEEIAYRGYLQTRIVDVLGPGRVGVLTAVLGSSVLFGLIHTEQGVIGVVLTFFDALFFSALKLRLGAGLWPAVLAHGFNNTIGLTAYFLIGPVYGLW
jgi:membrane protease YdiL (CAAX protease family)